MCLLPGHRFGKEVTVQNQGKHPVTLVWSNATFAALKSKQSKGQKKAGDPKMVGKMDMSLKSLCLLGMFAALYSASVAFSYRAAPE